MLVPFAGDTSIPAPWAWFSGPSRNALRRMLGRIVSDSSDISQGLPYAIICEATIEDLRDTVMVGEIRIERCLRELRAVYFRLENENPYLNETPASSPNQPSPRESTAKIRLRNKSMSTDETNVDFEEWLESEALDLTPLENAPTIESLQDEVLEIFRTVSGFNDRTQDILINRFAAFGESTATLEEIGLRHGVSRERIRQIEKKYEGIQLVDKLENIAIFERIREVANESKSLIEFNQKVVSSSLSSNPEVSLETILALAQILLTEDKFARLQYAITELESRDLVDQQKAREFHHRIQKSRTGLGLINLNTYESMANLTRSEVESAITRAYPRAIFFGNIALARTLKLDTAFENTIAKQLLIHPSATSRELLDGIERYASYRSIDVPKDEDALMGIIEVLAGAPPMYSSLEPNLREIPEFSPIEKWLIDIFTDAPKGVLHRTELVEAALASEINYSSVGVYLLKNPIFRSHGDSVYSLLGTRLSDSEILKYADQKRSEVEPAVVEFEIHVDLINISIYPNINSLGGVVFARRALKDVMKEKEFQTQCKCGKLISTQRAKVTKSNFLTGFTSMFKHAMHDHRLTLANKFDFEVDLNTDRVTFVPPSE